MAGKPLATGNLWESMEICEIIQKWWIPIAMLVDSKEGIP